MIRVLDARFVASAVKLEQAPATDLPEVAFVGRSNVGKSSMINTLVGRRKLVRVSNTPGRTRMLNFFEVTLEQDAERRLVRLADLPGYGYAKVAKSERASWDPMIRDYLEKRPTLAVVVSIIDAEVGPTSDDARTLDYLVESARGILVVATKLDRLPKAKRKPRLDQLCSQLGVPREALIGFSAMDKAGVDEVWESLLAVLFPPGSGAERASSEAESR